MHGNERTHNMKSVNASRDMQAIEGGHMLIILLFIVRNLKRTMETIPFSTNNMSFEMKQFN